MDRTTDESVGEGCIGEEFVVISFQDFAELIDDQGNPSRQIKKANNLFNDIIRVLIPKTTELHYLWQLLLVLHWLYKTG